MPSRDPPPKRQGKAPNRVESLRHRGRQGLLRALEFAGVVRRAGWKRWLAPVALLAVAAVFGVVLIGKMKREVWAYYTDDEGNRAEVQEDKTRYVLWEDSKPITFPDGKDAEERGDAEVHLTAGHFEAAFSPNGTMMVFARWSDPALETNADLYLSQWDGRVWSRPEAIASVNTERYHERSPAFSRDGHYLYFASDRPGGPGGKDLYVARWSGETWEGVEPLGPAINSSHDESGPAPSADGSKIYFSSNRAGASAEDIFVAQRLPPTDDPETEDSSLPPVPRFAPAEPATHLNSRQADVQAALTGRGDHVFLASDRQRTRHAGYRVYFSRVVEGVSLPPEPVDLYLENGDVTDPAVRMDGFDLLFSSNHESIGNDGYRLYRTTTREVIGYTDLSRWEQFKELMKNIAWWIFLALAALLALIYLLEKWRDITSLFHKCLAGSAVAHLLLLLLMMAWLIAKELEKESQPPPPEIALTLDALAEEELALESVPDETEITQPDLSLPAEKVEANFDVPDFEPQDAASAVPIDSQVQNEALPVEVMPTQAETVERPRLEPAEPSTLLTELSESALPEPEAPVLEERQLAEASEPAQPADDPFRPEQSLPAAARPAEIHDVVDNAADIPTDTAQIEPAESIADNPAPLTVVRPVQAEQPVDAPDDAQPLESDLLAELPDSPAIAPGTGQLEEPAQEPAEPAANPDDDLFHPGDSLPEVANAPTHAGVAGDNAAPSQTGAADIAEGSLATTPAARGPADSVGEAASESQRSESTTNTALAPQLPQTTMVDPGAPRLDEGDRQLGNPADRGGDQFHPDDSIARASTPLQSPPLAGAPLPVEAEVGDVAAGRLSAQPAVTGSSEAAAESAAEASLPPAAPPSLAPELPATALLDPGAPPLQEGDRPTGIPADHTRDQFTPGPTPLASTLAQLNKGTDNSGESPATDPTNPAELAPGQLTSSPAGASSSPPLAEARADSPLSDSSVLVNHLPATALLDPGSPRLEEGHEEGDRPTGVPEEGHQEGDRPTGVPANSSGDQFNPNGPKLVSTPASGSAPADSAPSRVLDSDSVGDGVLVSDRANVASPLTGLEASPSDPLAGGGAVAPASLDPSLADALLPGELEAPNNTGAVTDFLKKQRGRPTLDVIKQLGGSDGTEKAIRASLQWLAENQEDDGRWDARQHGAKGDFDTGVTGLALLCFYGWGARHDEDGKYRNHVSKALDWLLAQQDEEGDLSGEGLMYCHAIASIALCEAYGITKDLRLLEPAERCIAYTLAAQSKTKGGWRYHPGDDTDTSITGWQYMAIHSARLAGLEVPEASFALVRRWLDRAGGGKFGGLYGYQAPARNSPAMVATGMFCRQLDLVPPTDPKQVESASMLKMHPMKSRNLDYYYIYYATLALYQHQGPIWDAWNERLKDIVPLVQHQIGSKAGSWDPSRGLAGNGGRVTSTTLATLSLEVYYRLLPMYGFRGDEAPPAKNKSEPAR